MDNINEQYKRDYYWEREEDSYTLDAHNTYKEATTSYTTEDTVFSVTHISNIEPSFVYKLTNKMKMPACLNDVIRNDENLINKSEMFDDYKAELAKRLSEFLILNNFLQFNFEKDFVRNCFNLVTTINVVKPNKINKKEVNL